MSKAVVLALVGVLAVIATGLASAGLDPRGAYRELAADVSPVQDPAAPVEDRDTDPTPCGDATGADDRSRDVDDDNDADCEGEAAGGEADGGDNGDEGDDNGSVDPDDAEVKKVTICHYEGNGSWHTITPSVSAIYKDGHDGHPNDIIPPFDYTDKKEPKEYPGKNWNAEGQAIFDNDCVRKEPPPSCPSKAALTATDASGQGSREQYTFQEPVWARGEDLTPNATFAVTVTHNQLGTVMANTTATTDGSGRFVALAWDGANAIEGDEGYRLEATSTACSRDDNFQYRRTGQPPAKPKLKVRKTIVGASNKPNSDFAFRINGGQPTAFETDGENELSLDPGIYSVTERQESGFTTTTDNCSGIVLAVGQNVVPVCTITNTARPAEPLKLKVKKVVVDSTKPVSEFSFTVNGQTTPFDPSGENIVTLPPGTYTVTEPPVEGFTTTYEGCSNIVISSAQPPVPVCTIRNTAKQKPPDKVWPVGNFVKCVDNFNDGTFRVWFGYGSSNTVAVTIPIGELNKVTPVGTGGVDRGQPSTFQPGIVQSAFMVTGGPGQTVSWQLTSPPLFPGFPPFQSTASARAEFTKKCSSPPDPPAPTVNVVVTCVDNRGSTYSARFGYDNPTAASISLPVGEANKFDPLPEYRRQPELFTPGNVPEAVVVTGISNSVDLTWRVKTGNGAPSTATAGDTFATKCSEEPPPEPLPPEPLPPEPPLPPGPDRGPIGIFVQCITTRGETYDAVFGYQNDNTYTVTIPVGSANRFLPGGDRGQTTTFLPGNHQDAFTVERIPSRQLVTWAVTYAGATRFARPDSGFTECAAEPPDLQPIGLFACIVDRGDSFDAVFGYENDNPVDINVPIGLQNFVIPRPVNRRQPTVLTPGRHENAFTVRGVNSAILAWTVKHEGVRTVIVTSEYPIKCAGSPPTTLPLKVFPLCVRRTGSTYMARFGYINPNHGDIVLPIGASNSVGPRPQNRGQPTTLRPGIAWSAFTVRRIQLNGAVTWTLKYAGETARATATADLKRNCLFAEEGPEAQLEIDKSVEPDAVVVGDRVRFRIVVRNEGTTTAQNATVIDRMLDERVVQLSATTSQGRCVVRSSMRVICRLGPLDPGDAATITVLARARAPGESRNRAVVLSLPEDFGPDNIDRVTMVVSPFISSTKPPFTG